MQISSLALFDRFYRVQNPWLDRDKFLPALGIAATGERYRRE